MATKSIVFILGFLVAASNAAFSINDLTLRQEEELIDYAEPEYEYLAPEHHERPELQALFESQAALTEAFEGVLEQLQGFEDNAQALGREFNFYVESNTLDLISAFVPLFEAAPPEVLKTFITDVINGFINAVKELGPIIKQNNPLHPQESLDLRSLIRRRLTTLSTFGGSVEHLINAVDQLVVNYVDALEEGLHIGVEKCQQVVDGLEQMPAEMVKTMVVQTIKQHQAAMKNAQSYRESVTAHY